jgi:hypothetical protein
MTRVVLDANTLARLRDSSDLIEVRDELGKVVGYYYPIRGGAATATRSPYSREELERLRQQRTGRPLDEILKGLQEA